MTGIDTTLLVGLIAAAAALLGIVLGSLLEMWRERTRWKREKQVRYNADRIQAYNNFTGQVSGLILRLGLIQNKGIAASASATEDVVANFYALGAALERLKLVASPPVVAAADELYTLTGDFFNAIATKTKTIDKDLQKYRHLQSAFYKAAQKELELQ